MTGRSGFRFFGFVLVALAVATVSLSARTLAHETDQTTPDPGFRPDSDLAAVFVDSLDSVTIAVYPTIVHREDRTAHSFASQDQIIGFINQNKVSNAVSKPLRVDLGGLKRRSQWDLFESDLQRIGEALQGRHSDVDYHFFMAFVLPVNNKEIFGIHCYVLDRQGRNAFSFLLNSHHQLFVEAGLHADNSSETARSRLMEEATRVGMTAFMAQHDRARQRTRP